MGWARIKNGDWLRLGQEHFDVFVTVDRNLFFQQSLPQYTLAVIILQAPTNRLRDLEPLVPKLLGVLPEVPKGQVRWVSA